MRPVAVSLDLLELHHLKNILEAEGIACRVRNDLLTRLAGEIPFIECAAELHLIDERDRWRAETLIASFRSAPAPPGPAWNCLQCGESMDNPFTACWRCGAPRAE